MDIRARGAALLGALLVLSGCGDGDPDGKAEPRAPQPSEPASLEGRLLFSRFDEGSHTFLSTHVARADGSDEVAITMPGPEGGGRWSGSGEEIAVMTELPDGRIGTAIITGEGGVTRVLETSDPTLNLVCTVWSPDDSRLACEGFDDLHPARNGIYTVRASDGRDLARVTASPDGSADLPGDFSPDGRRLVFERAESEEFGRLMDVAVSGGRPRMLYDQHVEDPGRYSPDGGTILTAGGGDILELDQDGRVTRRIDEPGHVLFGAVWSPDGTHIAYSDAVGGPHADIYVSLPDGTDRARVTSTPENEIRVEWGATP